MAFLDSLISEMEEHRIGILDIDITKARPTSNGSNEIRGAIAEHLVREWINKCLGAEHYSGWPKQVSSYNIRELPSGIVVFEEGQTKMEYDFVISYDGGIVLFEVKSLRLNGVEGKLERALELSKEIFPDVEDIGMIVCFPIYANKVVDAQKMEAAHPNVRCLDLGYRRKQLNSATREYCQRKEIKD